MQRKRWLLGTLVAGFLFAFASCASAQAVIPEEMDLNYSIDLGAAFPITSNTDNTAFPSVGLSWFGPAPENLAGRSALGLSADWIPVKRNDNETVQLVPVLFNFRQYGTLFGNYRIFTTLGIGIEAATDDIPEMNIENGAQFAWQAAVGVDITNRLYFQGRFIAGTDPGNDGLAIAGIGYRF